MAAALRVRRTTPVLSSPKAATYVWRLTNFLTNQSLLPEEYPPGSGHILLPMPVDGAVSAVFRHETF
eukprot:1181264-Prorocentrum_minimum.AAC.4